MADNFNNVLAKILELFGMDDDALKRPILPLRSRDA